MLTSNCGRRIRGARFPIALACALFPVAALAHHVMDGAMPTTVVQGFVSGLGHPVIGLDHLLFVLTLGVLCWRIGAGVREIAGFLGASLLGIALHLAAVGIPGNESLVALSLLALGVSLWSGRHWSPRGLTAMAVIAGVVHGYAYGESIVGAESGVLTSYLLGLVLVQSLLAAAAYRTAKAVARRYASRQAYLGWIGVLASGFGAGFFLLSLG